MTREKFSLKQCGLLCFGSFLVGVVLTYYYVGQRKLSFSEQSKQFYRNNILEEKVKVLKEDRVTESKSDQTFVPIDKSEIREERISTMSLNDSSQLEEITVIVIFTNAKSNYGLREKFKLTVTSMLSFAKTPVALHILGDVASQNIAKTIVEENVKSNNYRIQGLDIEQITKDLYDIVKDMQRLFSVKKSYYSDALFFLSIAIHRVLSDTFDKVIMLDSDLKFNTDITELYALFSQFSETNVMGIAHDSQPVYRHRFSAYRSKNKGTRVGEPPPDGLPGFNSGVLLLDLKKMKNSELYNSLLSAEVAENLTQKYSFSGHLGDQCFFTLLSLEHEQLFYTLPCTWNRQLCEWWRGKGYDNVFDLYFKCEGHINIYHGNCNTKIPDTDS